MPYGVPAKQFGATVVMCFTSMIMGSMMVHVVMMPDQTPESFQDENAARFKAIKAVQDQMTKN